jgi:hypothetical protein
MTAHYGRCASIQCATCYPSLGATLVADRAYQTPAPMTEGEAGFGAGQTPASPPLPSGGEAGTYSSDADAVGATASEGSTPAAAFDAGPATTAPRPQWSTVDDDTASLLDLIAEEHPATLSEDEEWTYFLGVLEDVAREHGVIDQNLTRPRLRGQIKSSRTGAFFHRAARAGLIRAAGWTVSDDREGKNSGKPTRSYDWLGT